VYLYPWTSSGTAIVVSTWLKRPGDHRQLSFSQEGTQHVRGRHHPRDAYDSRLDTMIVQLILGRANMNAVNQLEGFIREAVP